MARGKWRKYQEAYKLILEIIKKKKGHQTTNEIRDQLDKKHNIIFSWTTMNKYLLELERTGYIKGVKVKKTNCVHMWTMRGIE